MMLTTWMMAGALAWPGVKVHKTTVRVTAPQDAEAFPRSSDDYKQLHPVALGRRVRGPDVASATTSDDGRMRVGCEVTNGHLWLELTPTGPWTERIPERVGCRAGKHEVQARLERVPPRYTEAAELSAGPDQPAELRWYGEFFAMTEYFALPAGVDWAQGSFPVEVTAGAAPSELSCEVVQPPGAPGRAALRVRAMVQADAQAACRLRTTGGEEVRVPVHLVCGTLSDTAWTRGGCSTAR